MNLGLGGAILLGVVAIAVLQAVLSKPDPPTTPKSPEQIAAGNQKEATFQRVVQVMRRVREANRNPESVKWEAVRANNDGSVICVDYRGQNGFGGMSREFVVVVNTTVSQKAADWNRHCTVPLLDMMYAKRAL